jgi:hypothetical protein
MQRVMIIPHKDSISFTAEGSVDPSCYWHGTVEELREERGRRHGIKVPFSKKDSLLGFS